jgi:hypothetical protein
VLLLFAAEARFFAMEEQDRPQRLILRALGHTAVYGQVGKKRFHVRLAQLLGMNPSAGALAVKP